MKATHPVLFREVQRFRDVWWVMALVIGIAVLQWAIFLSFFLDQPMGGAAAPFGFAGGFWLLFGIGLPVFFIVLRLEVEVTPEAVFISFVPLHQRVIRKLDIAGIDVLTYRPLGDFGGWGIRGWGGRVAYNVRGDRGVELTLVDGRRVLIGSQRPAELAAALSIGR